MIYCAKRVPISISNSIKTPFIGVKSIKSERDMEKVSSFMIQVVFSKESGIMISAMVEALSYSPMAINSKESIKAARLMVRAHTHGEMEKFLMESGKMARRRVTVYGEVFTVTVILVSG